MKFKIVFLALVSLLFVQRGNCQSKAERPEINYLQIKDSVLISAITKLVKQVETTDTIKDNMFKKGYGYVTLYVKEYSQKDTLIDYYVSPELFSLKEDSSDQLYPDYYTYVNNRLVIIYINVLSQLADRTYSKKSKAQIRNLVNRTLEKTKKVTFYDVNDKKAFTDKHFRIDYLMRHFGIHIYILKNKPAIIVKKLEN